MSTVPLGTLDPELMIRMRDKYGLKHFVETGTSSGATSAQAAPHFERVDTIEPVHERYVKARQFLSQFKNVFCHFGQSVEFLGTLDLSVPTLYWIDSHWCGGQKIGVECPVIDELRILNWNNSSGVILIDDHRLFANPPPPPHVTSEWPTLQDIKYAAMQRKVMPIISVEGDVIVIEPGIIE